MFQHVLHLYVFPSSSSFVDFVLARKIGGIGGTPTHPLQKVIQGQGIIEFYYQILTRKKINSTVRKRNQKHFKGREGRKGRKGRKRTGKRQTKQRKQEQGRGRCKSNRKERGFMKRGKRKRKGKNRRSARNGSKCSPEGGSFFENLTGRCETGLD